LVRHHLSLNETIPGFKPHFETKNNLSNPVKLCNKRHEKNNPNKIEMIGLKYADFCHCEQNEQYASYCDPERVKRVEGEAISLKFFS